MGGIYISFFGWGLNGLMLIMGGVLMCFGKVEDGIFALHRAVLDDHHHNAFLEKVAFWVDVGEVALPQKQ